MIRILHFSDIHLERDRGVLGRYVAGLRLDKRALGLANLILRRRRRFRHAPEKVAALAPLLDAHRVDYVLCTGDYTALGADGELAHARRAIDPLTRAPLGYGTVPGNHDVYVKDPGDFASRFGAFLETDLPDYRAPDSPYPWVRLLGDGLAVVGVDSARPNPQPWRSSGRIPAPQLDALERLLGAPELADRFVIVATHYAPRLENGQPDAPLHGLVNADELFHALRPARRGMVAFGHVHRRYRVRVPECPLLLSGAGSATDDKSNAIWLYEVDDTPGAGQATAYPGDWDAGRWVIANDPAWSTPDDVAR